MNNITISNLKITSISFFHGPYNVITDSAFYIPFVLEFHINFRPLIADLATSFISFLHSIQNTSL